MKADWRLESLGQVCELISGQHIEAKDYNESGRGVPYLTGPSDFGDRSPLITKWTEFPKRMASPGDILITVKGSGVGKINYLDQEVAISRQLMAIRPHGINTEFLYAFLSTHFDHFQSRSTGAAIPGIAREDVLSLKCPVPPPSEQQRIMVTINEALDGIATARANTEKNLQSASEVFESERESILVGKGPGWRLAPLSELCTIKHGFAFQGAFFRPEGRYVLLTPGNFYEAGGYRDRDEKQKYYIGEVPDAYILSKGDLLIAMTEQAAGLLGSPILVPASDKFLHNQRLGLVSGNPGVPWRNEFFFHVFNTRGLRTAVHASGSGVKVRHTSPSKIGDVIVSYPTDVGTQSEIAVAIQNMQEECDKLASIYSQKLDALDELRQSLLHRAFNGDL